MLKNSVSINFTNKFLTNKNLPYKIDLVLQVVRKVPAACWAKQSPSEVESCVCYHVMGTDKLDELDTATCTKTTKEEVFCLPIKCILEGKNCLVILNPTPFP